MYDKRNYFDFDAVNFPVSDGDVPRALLGVCLNLFGTIVN